MAPQKLAHRRRPWLSRRRLSMGCCRLLSPPQSAEGRGSVRLLPTEYTSTETLLRAAEAQGLRLSAAASSRVARPTSLDRVDATSGGVCPYGTSQIAAKARGGAPGSLAVACCAAPSAQQARRQQRQARVFRWPPCTFAALNWR